ncbi:hypothetical protein PN36_21590 [Candidatus Thiomargarita nelsonii]|uniref:Uncharacterized protein n=1 Tax=Candidatus Thiomargarita nelsonii TaxID=1003181 RepID=A0A0A6P566_9GAMM|nr:hypothetical protein PN36_21590 [Candidatus Thiomargarita nelsonii]
MQTKERLLSGNHFQVTLDIAAPDYVSANFTSHEVGSWEFFGGESANYGASSFGAKRGDLIKSSKIQQTLDALENHKPSRVNVNSTQLLRDIRDNG